ncbi:MAG: FAD-dependent oxidoreductase [Ardenticatenia bacterium]|nr:FAD-dependent oxidoreductase [Ardenticatenia bacterium]
MSPQFSHTASRGAQPRLRLAHGLSFADLYQRAGLARLDEAFLSWLRERDGELHARLLSGRADPLELDRKTEGDLLLDLGPELEDFIGQLFGIGADLAAAREAQDALAPIHDCKRQFIQRVAIKKHSAEMAAGYDGPALGAALAEAMGQSITQLGLAKAILAWQAEGEGAAPRLELAAQYAAWAHYTAAGRHAHAGWVLFKAPGKKDPFQLIPVDSLLEAGSLRLSLGEAHQRRREGFSLTDAGASLTEAMDEVHYCIYCQHQGKGKDSCSVGLKDAATGAVKTNALGREMLGCPLEERISEFQELKSKGGVIGPLAVITVDNPLCAGTGHRICNDCMVSCVYQNQNRDPVNIPQAETRTLKDVLDLPWGFEIYSLLTRWQPLNLARPLPKPDSGYKVLVVGLGPAGYTLAHHLLQEGHAVAAIDGLKIEPLDASVSGVAADGGRAAFLPVHSIETLRESLDERVNAGFGGVAEYGITVRWDKNYLKVLRLLLERRAAFSMFGGVRFGGTLTMEDAWALGFDHVALCMGAGKPTIIDMENGLARGVRQASDFLMALQLTGAARRDTVANLHLRLPVAVIGGGLTAIDSCTEALAYYPVQVEKFLDRYQTLADEQGEDKVRASWSAEEREIAEEWLGHARAIRDERAAAAVEGREAHIRELLQAWGGSSIVYRKTLQEAPSYRNNWEEVEKAFQEGIRFAEGLSPVAVEVDGFGHAAGLRCKTADGGETTLPARSILVAAGTVPNTVLAREQGGILLDGKFFQAVDEDGEPVTPERKVKPAAVHVLMNPGAADGDADQAGRASFFGDLHPSFAGNVVAAMASARAGYGVIGKSLARRAPRGGTAPDLFARLNEELRPTVHRVDRLTPNIVDVIVRAPRAARQFQPGQFYRLQNYETFAPRTSDTVLAMEGLALTGAWVDKEAGLLSMIVLEMGGSSSLVDRLKPGEPVVVMGPTGRPTATPGGETVMLVGGGLGNAVLFSIGEALRRHGSRVLYFAGYKNPQDRYKVEEILEASDVVVWACDVAADFHPERPQDMAFTGNIVQAMRAYAAGELGEVSIPMSEVDRVIAIGSDRMMRAVAEARHGLLAPYLKAGHIGLGSINSPMQCMMKEICAQCLQRHVDPVTGQAKVVFSCFDQDQPLDHVDWGVLNQRLGQNSLQEKLTRLWIARELGRLEPEGELALV